MVKSYNVVVNSNFCTTGTAGNANSDKNYYIDWSAILPQGEYELSFSFISETNIVTSLATLPNIYVDFLSQANIDAPQPGFQATASQFLGNVFPINLDPNAHNTYFRADVNFNAPIFLVNRPFNNEFRVQIVTNDNPSVSWVDQANPTPQSISPYVMNLHFKLVKDRSNVV